MGRRVDAPARGAPSRPRRPGRGPAGGYLLQVHVDWHHRLTTTLAELTRASVATIGLRAQVVDEVGALIRSITGEEALVATVDRIAVRTNGNPYFVGEIARLGDDRLPSTITAVVRSRLAVADRRPVRRARPQPSSGGRST